MATAMAASAAERAVLEEEFRWLLHAEVHAVLRQLQDILKVTHPPVPPGLPSFLSTGSCESRTADAELDPCKYPLLRVGIPTDAGMVACNYTSSVCAGSQGLRP